MENNDLDDWPNHVLASTVAAMLHWHNGLLPVDHVDDPAT
jgi:hypothetical protein